METTLPSSPQTQDAAVSILRVIKRHQPNGLPLKPVSYDENKIAAAMQKAFVAVEGEPAQNSARVKDIVTRLAHQITHTLLNRHKEGLVNVEDIQDQVELALMRAGEQRVARAYVLYREERRRLREQRASFEPTAEKGAQTTQEAYSQVQMAQQVQEACQGLTHVDAQAIIKETQRNLFEGASLADLRKALQLSAKAMLEKEPNYGFVAARLLLDELCEEALRFLQLNAIQSRTEMAAYYPTYFQHFIHQGIECELLDPRLATFDLNQLGAALLPERDLKFNYLGLQTLYDRYFLHHHGVRFELPQAFFMRVAMGVAINEAEKEKRAIEFYTLLSSFDYMSSTPTLFNSGTLRPQLSSCYLTTIPDDLDGIYSAIKDNALLSKFAGGLGNDWTPVRAMGSHIKGTNGKSQGVVPFLNVANASAVAVNQGGKRKGAVCAYLETWHLDIEEFLELRKNTGDDRRRTHDMNTANWIPDLFMRRVHENAHWTLFSPRETPELHELCGEEFEKAYVAYEQKAAHGELRQYKTIQAISLWRKMLSMLFETGHPWITFKDPCNLRSPQQHVGVVHSSNLCTEITLNTSADEIAVCNLGSINLSQHINDRGLDTAKLEKTIRTAIRILDNVIDINYYAVPQARRSNLKHRPIGLGLMGFQDALYQLRIPYMSDNAVQFADRAMEAISYFAIQSSNELAKERGSYATFEGSLWSKGILPIDSLAILQKQRGVYLDVNKEQTLDWTRLRTAVQTSGMRNSNVMAIAPTATISNICGVVQSIEPTYQNLFVKSNLSGEFTVINPYLVADLKALDLWNDVMVNDLKYFNGSLKMIERIPAELKQLYATAFEIDPFWLVEAAARRQKWIDQGQSLNLYMAQPSGKKLDALYRLAWLRGLKTTYYLRSMGATNAEKSTVHDTSLNAIPSQTIHSENEPKACSLSDPDCEACQ
ncbi:MAG: ribonucleoside-diphosphate reductase subunit alpha [Gammaproteobacteria bacterium]|nr:ribonucleoside-diphosphate reductase subunit alpha [Gammaproteobacteria bacterium]